MLSKTVDGTRVALRSLKLHVAELVESFKPESDWQPLWSLKNDCYMPGLNYNIKTQ